MAALLTFQPGYLDYDFGPAHPLRPERITASLDLLETTGLWDRATSCLAAPPAAVDELTMLHSPEYVAAVARAGTDRVPHKQLAAYGLTTGDNPAFPGMHEAAAAVAGGAIAAARAVGSGAVQHAFHPAGGWHHALRDRASGFCIYNDAALAAAVLEREFGARVLYLDFDAHHGDGVQWLFYRNPNVMTVSFHESGRYLFPGTGGVEERGEGPGEGYAVNVPFAPFTRDKSWLEALHDLVPRIAARFRPDVILSAHGADTHAWDPITHLSLTTQSFVEQAALTHQLAHDYAGGRWLAFGSGGYDARRVVPRSWAIIWSEMTGQVLPDAIPSAWLERWGGPDPFPRRFRDESHDTSLPRYPEVERINRDTIRLVRDLL